MKNWMKENKIRLPEHKRVQFFLLLAVCAAEVLFISTEGMFRYIGYYLIEDFIAIPCFLFLGTLLIQKPSGPAKRNLMLSAAAVIWFIAAQIRHRTMGMSAVTPVFFCLSYLMAFPFASVLEDHEHAIGLKLCSSLYVVANLLLVSYSLLLVLDFLPGFMKNFVFWDGTRLHTLWHSNTSSCLAMIGIGIGLSYMFQTCKPWKKTMLTVYILLQLLVMALTNSRTSLMMACVLIGFAVFLAVGKGGWRRLLAAVVALAVAAGLFVAAGAVYNLNQDIHKAKAAAQLQQRAEETLPPPSADSSVEAAPETPETTAPPETTVTQVIRQDSQTGEIIIQGQNMQGTLKSDLKTLNGRTGIWNAVFQSVRNDATLKWWGTDYIGTILSANGAIKVEHAHNSWMEALMALGIPGLLFALIYTGLALWSAAVVLLKGNTERWKKMLAVLVLCILMASFLEPFLFVTKIYYHFIEFIFFFLLGYLDLWRRQALHPERFPENQKA